MLGCSFRTHFVNYGLYGGLTRVCFIILWRCGCRVCRERLRRATGRVTGATYIFENVFVVDDVTGRRTDGERHLGSVDRVRVCVLVTEIRLFDAGRL